VTRLALTRSGGFGGAVQRFAVDEDHLAPAERAELHRLLAAADLDALPDARVAPAPAVERFTYRLTVQDGARTRTARFGEPEMTDGLRALVRWVEGRG
jgi:hypothetical protein